MDKLEYILGHAPSFSNLVTRAAPFVALAKKGQAITTRYFAKKQNELKQKACAELSRSVLSFVQL
jgi:hypothetical protein